MTDIVEFNVTTVTEMHTNEHPVFQGQQVILRFTVFDEDNNILDLSEVGSTTEVILKPVNRSKKTFTGTLPGGGTDGKVQYTTIAEDLDRTGVWKAQVLHTKASGQVIPSSIITFTVQPRL